ncbi:MAG: protein kinase [Dehalococcoidia bacterium]
MTAESSGEGKAEDARIGAVLSGRYELTGLLGKGGMSTVYRAHDNLLGREVAVKVVAGWLQDDETFSHRFIEEARAAARLSHPNIVTVHDAVEEDRLRYIVMEVVEGHSLEELKQVEPDRGLEIALQLCSALEYAHGQGIIHCDVKPANILVTDAGRAKLVDFGIARAATQTQSMATTVLGTAAYMAPETVEGQRPDARSDIYSLAMVLYEQLAGRLPFEGETAAALTAQRLVRDPLPIREAADVEEPLAAVIMSALSRDPEARPQTAAELAEALREARDREEPNVTPAVAPLAVEAEAPLEPAAQMATPRADDPIVDEPFQTTAHAPIVAPETPKTAITDDEPSATAEVAPRGNAEPAATLAPDPFVSERSRDSEPDVWTPPPRAEHGEVPLLRWLAAGLALIALFAAGFFVTRALLDDRGDSGADPAEYFGQVQGTFDVFEQERAAAAAEFEGRGGQDAEANKQLYVQFLRSFIEVRRNFIRTFDSITPADVAADAHTAYLTDAREVVQALSAFADQVEQTPAAEVAAIDTSAFEAAQADQVATCQALQQLAADEGFELTLRCQDVQTAF